MFEVDSLPQNPGCYIFRDSKGNALYVGKAKNIRKRVKSYFRKRGLDPKTQGLVKRIRSVDFIVTDSEVEAIILENNLIKRNQPRYNIDLRDSKRYAGITITGEDFPRLLFSRRRDGKGEFFGPFVSAQERDYVMKVLTRTFRLRTCRRIPKKACLRHHISLCSAPCVGAIGRGDYGKAIGMARQVLRGKTKRLLKDMKSEMETFSGAGNFESAMEIRDRMQALSALYERQKIERTKKYDEDVINFLVKGGSVYLVLFNVYKGTLSAKSDFVFDYKRDFLEEFLVQYYSDSPVPKEIILPVKTGEPVASFLGLKRKGKVKITVPKKGLKKGMLNLAMSNIEATFFGGEKKLSELKKRLKLGDLPRVIECFDISHISGTSTVGSMVQFRNARPYKDGYRRFRIRTVEDADDCRAIAEVVRRRYARLKREHAMLPDLVIIDGGKGQLNAALREIAKLGLAIPVISIAKKLEQVYVPKNPFPLNIKKNETASKFIREIRDEAHRFALAYSRLLRKKEVLR